MVVKKGMRGKKPDHGRGTALAASPAAAAGMQIKGRLWLEKDGETFLSWGRVVLLERVRDLGSHRGRLPLPEHGLQPRLGAGGQD